MKEIKNIYLRDVKISDLQIFFEQQLDSHANHMAGFTKKDPTDKNIFDLHWNKIIADESILINTIIVDDLITGYILTHNYFGVPEIGYWIGKEYWSKGIVTDALRLFLDIVLIRPIYARVIFDNIASIKVLEKCGFKKDKEEFGFANARNAEVKEYVYKLL